MRHLGRFYAFIEKFKKIKLNIYFTLKKTELLKKIYGCIFSLLITTILEKDNKVIFWNNNNSDVFLINFKV